MVASFFIIPWNILNYRIEFFNTTSGGFSRMKKNILLKKLRLVFKQKSILKEARDSSLLFVKKEIELRTSNKD